MEEINREIGLTSMIQGGSPPVPEEKKESVEEKKESVEEKSETV
jgi:hypothetical protein